MFRTHNDRFAPAREIAAGFLLLVTGLNQVKFEKGRSGNPSGRPKIPPEARELALAKTPDAIKTLGNIMQDKSAPPAARVSAAVAILDRALGKPHAEMTVNHNRDASNITEAELQRIIASAGGDGTAQPDAVAEKPDSVH